MNILELFWKTYRIKEITTDGSLSHYYFLRGFAWDVVNRACENATKKNGSWTVEEISAI